MELTVRLGVGELAFSNLSQSLSFCKLGPQGRVFFM